MPFIQCKFPSEEHFTSGRLHDPPGGEHNALWWEFRQGLQVGSWAHAVPCLVHVGIICVDNDTIAYPFAQLFILPAQVSVLFRDFMY